MTEFGVVGGTGPAAMRLQNQPTLAAVALDQNAGCRKDTATTASTGTDTFMCKLMYYSVTFSLPILFLGWSWVGLIIAADDCLWG